MSYHIALESYFDLVESTCTNILEFIPQWKRFFIEKMNVKTSFKRHVQWGVKFIIGTQSYVDVTGISSEYTYF